MEENLAKKRIEMLRSLMKERGIDLYLIPTADYHESEYVGDYFKARSYISGFTGSAGTLVVTPLEAGLWTDGRYFIQAERQLEGSGITLYRMGVEGVLEMKDFIIQKIPEKGILGFDGRVVNAKLGQELEKELAKKKAIIEDGEDLVNHIWKDRPSLPCSEAFLLDVKYAGKSAREKIQALREEMKKKKANTFLLTCLDDIAWLFNIRGNDIIYNPVILSYAVIRQDEALFFVNERSLSNEVRAALKKEGIDIMPYDAIYEYVRILTPDETVLLDGKRVNYSIMRGLHKDIKIVDEMNPTTRMKAVKNETELKNLRRSHLKDAVAVTKFMYWLKTNIGKIEMTEITASDYLEDRRKEQEGFLEPSFDTISAYNENAAMMHYSAVHGSEAILKPEGLLLVDSGGQYYEGTTDITRTFVLGPILDEWKMHYTLVAKSMLNLMNAKFLYGCSGLNLDILAREPLWNLGIDYRCGTGHGVGYLLNVHEGPNGFRWRRVPERDDQAVLEEGMVTTDEPGIYVEDSHGIRIENELICRKQQQNEYGQFMEFETITYVPIDLDGIDTKYLNRSDIQQLNEYHAMVYDKISSHLTKEERDWLMKYTRPIEFE